MELPMLDSINVKGKRVLLRLDLDVDPTSPLRQSSGLRGAGDFRLKAAVPTIKYLLEHECGRIVIIGHRGRPQNSLSQSLSLEPVAKHLEKLLLKELGKEKMKSLDMFVMENLRFNPGEEKNDPEFAKELAGQGDVYINDAFASCHDNHASIVALPQQFKSKYKNTVAAGLHLIEEVKNLEKVLDNPKKPVVFVMGGGKMDKALLVNRLLDHADWVLVGGVLPKKIKSYCREKDGRMCIVAAHLTPNGEDITPDSARNFAEIIKSAGTIVWNGPMGDIDQGYYESTHLVGEAVAQSHAFRVVGGGDTIKALKKLGIIQSKSKSKFKIDYISTGGGAMLEFLAYGDLPGLRALRGSV